MNDVSKRMLWQKIREKMDKNEKITMNEIVWGVITESGRVSRKHLAGADREEALTRQLEHYKTMLKKSAIEQRALYDEQKASHEKGLTEAKDFFKKFQDQCKEIKAEVNKTKVTSNIKEVTIGILREYLEMLHREIQEETAFPDYDTWLKDNINIAENQLDYLKLKIKKAKKETEKNMKDISKIEAEIPLPDGMKWDTEEEKEETATTAVV